MASPIPIYSYAGPPPLGRHWDAAGAGVGRPRVSVPAVLRARAPRGAVRARPPPPAGGASLERCHPGAIALLRAAALGRARRRRRRGRAAGRDPARALGDHRLLPQAGRGARRAAHGAAAGGRNGRRGVHARPELTLANFRAIHSVGHSLATWLKNSFPTELAAGQTFDIRLISSGEMNDADEPGPGVTLYLYRVTVNEHLRNAKNPNDPSGSRAPLSL